MINASPEYPITPASPSEVGPLWQELEILPGPTNPAEQIGYLEGYAIGQKAVIALIAEDFAGEQALKKEAYRQATTDSLTGLPNRLGITLKLDELIASKPGRTGVLFVDIDGLKETNDTLGHKAGDQLIIKGAHVLDESVRDSDTTGHGAARLSGDELIVVVDDTDIDQLEMIGARLRQNLNAAGVPASLGAAMHLPGDTATDLIARADAAMYEIKKYRKEIREEQQFIDARTALPADKREFYDGVYEELWEYPGGSPEEFQSIYIRKTR
jgi:diguanylate cyclase (GGDEF)-like protein